MPTFVEPQAPQTSRCAIVQKGVSGAILPCRISSAAETVPRRGLYLWGFGDVKSLGWIVALVFSIAAALRLARFNVALDEPGKLIGRRIAPDYIAPVVALAVVLVATLVTYPYLSVTLGVLTYLALIPLSMRRYAELEQDFAVVDAPTL